MLPPTVQLATTGVHMLPPTVQLVITAVVILVGVPLVVTAMLREFAKVGTNND